MRVTRPNELIGGVEDLVNGKEFFVVGKRK